MTVKKSGKSNQRTSARLVYMQSVSVFTFLWKRKTDGCSFKSSISFQRTGGKRGREHNFSKLQRIKYVAWLHAAQLKAEKEKIWYFIFWVVVLSKLWLKSNESKHVPRCYFLLCVICYSVNQQPWQSDVLTEAAFVSKHTCILWQSTKPFTL